MPVFHLLLNARHCENIWTCDQRIFNMLLLYPLCHVITLALSCLILDSVILILINLKKKPGKNAFNFIFLSVLDIFRKL